jgi:hypothetical protein
MVLRGEWPHTSNRSGRPPALPGYRAAAEFKRSSKVSNLSGRLQLSPESVNCLEPLGKKAPIGSRYGEYKSSPARGG